MTRFRRIARAPVAAHEAIGVVAICAVAFTIVAFINVHGNALGYDFRGNPWEAARAIAHGRSPYLGHMTPALLRTHSYAYLLPPTLAVLSVPLGVIPYAWAFAVWSVLSLAAFAFALWLVGLRSWLCFVLACLSFPLLDNLLLGQVGAFLALGYALVWRYRDRSYSPGIVVGAMIALKLLAWPLLIWFAFSRRWRACLTGAIAGPALAVAAWLIIGFRGIRDFPHGVSVDASVFGTRTHSVVAALNTLGLPQLGGTLVAAVLGLVLLLWVARCSARGLDGSAFAAATAASVYASPVVHPHYLLPLLVALAVVQPRPSVTWLALVGFWVSTNEPPSSPLVLDLSVGLGLLLVAATVLDPSVVSGPEPAGASEHSRRRARTLAVSDGR